MERETTKNLAVGSIKLSSGAPYNKIVEESKVDRKFEVRCHAGDAGHLEVASESVSVRIGQRICRDGKEELWSSLLVQCKERDDGSLAVEVVIFHPDWEEPLRIASIQSNPIDSKANGPVLRCDLERAHP